MSSNCSDPDSDCAEVLRQLHVYLDHEAGASLEEVIAEHLSDCNPCLARADFQRELRALIANRCTDRAPAALVDRVLAIIRGGTLDSR